MWAILIISASHDLIFEVKSRALRATFKLVLLLYLADGTLQDVEYADTIIATTPTAHGVSALRV